MNTIINTVYYHTPKEQTSPHGDCVNWLECYKQRLLLFSLNNLVTAHILSSILWYLWELRDTVLILSVLLISPFAFIIFFLPSALAEFVPLFLVSSGRKRMVCDSSYFLIPAFKDTWFPRNAVWLVSCCSFSFIQNVFLLLWFYLSMFNFPILSNFPDTLLLLISSFDSAMVIVHLFGLLYSFEICWILVESIVWVMNIYCVLEKNGCFLSLGKIAIGSNWSVIFRSSIPLLIS